MWQEILDLFKAQQGPARPPGMGDTSDWSAEGPIGNTQPSKASQFLVALGSGMGNQGVGAPRMGAPRSMGFSGFMQNQGGSRPQHRVRKASDDLDISQVMGMLGRR